MGHLKLQRKRTAKRITAKRTAKNVNNPIVCPNTLVEMIKSYN